MLASSAKRGVMPGTLLLIISVSFLFYAYSTGITETTKMNEGEGCECHSETPSSNILVTIAGSNEIGADSIATFYVTIMSDTITGAGVNIAASAGTLIPGEGLALNDGELMHTVPRAAQGGSVTFDFKLKAPSSGDSLTIYATGNSVNFSGDNTGDKWNFAANFVVKIIENPVAGVEDFHPTSFKLNQNYPNPFNPSTTISYNLPEQANVQLKIYSLSGEEIMTAADGTKDAGFYQYSFNASGVSSGVYYYKLIASNPNTGEIYFSETKKMLLIK